MFFGISDLSTNNKNITQDKQSYNVAVSSNFIAKTRKASVINHYSEELPTFILDDNSLETITEEVLEQEFFDI